MTCDSTVSESCCDGAHTSCRGKVAVGNTSDNLKIRTCTCKCHEARVEIVPERGEVAHPAHYGGDVVHETYKCLAAWGLTSNAYLWNTVKYISRAGRKDPAKVVVDLEKAAWYLNREIERLKSEK